MNAVQIDSRRKNVRVACECHCRQESAIRPAVDTDAARIDLWQFLQKVPGGLYILIFRRPPPAGIFWIVKLKAVTDAEPEIYRKYYVAFARQILIERVNI